MVCVCAYVSLPPTPPSLPFHLSIITHPYIHIHIHTHPHTHTHREEPSKTLFAQEDLYHVLSTEAIIHLSHALALSRTLLQSFEKLLFRLLALLGQGQAAWRARVMKAFGGILESDPLLMMDPQVKQAVLDRFQGMYVCVCVCVCYEGLWGDLGE